MRPGRSYAGGSELAVIGARDREQAAREYLAVQEEVFSESGTDPYSRSRRCSDIASPMAGHGGTDRVQ